MFVHAFMPIVAVNSFYQAYFQSDLLGKIIFMSLLATSVCSWTILIHKMVVTQAVKKNSSRFYRFFEKQKNNLLNPSDESIFKESGKNPFCDLFQVLRKQTIDILNKNHRFGAEKGGGAYLSPSDIDSISSHLSATIDNATKRLEENLFILSTIVGLSPLLGLLGTVWGILTTFSELQSHALGSSNQMVLGGLALALTTTVLGLLNAIPALIGYNYLKNTIHNYETEMEGFSNEMLSSVEMQYRKVELG